MLESRYYFILFLIDKELRQLNIGHIEDIARIVLHLAASKCGAKYLSILVTQIGTQTQNGRTGPIPPIFKIRNCIVKIAMRNQWRPVADTHRRPSHTGPNGGCFE